MAKHSKSPRTTDSASRRKSSNPPTETRNPFYVHCGDCSHEWIAFYVPIRLDLISRFKSLACPMCTSKKVLCNKAKKK